MSAVPVSTRRRLPALAGALSLSGATVASGVLAYAFQVLAARTLDQDAYGRVALLWAATFLVAIAVFRPVEQTLARTLVDRIARGHEVRSVVRAGLLAAGAAIIAVAAAGAISWSWAAHRLFGGDDVLMAMLVAGVCAYGLSYVARGLFGGLRWFNGYALLLLTDGVGRFVVALPLLVAATDWVAGAAIAAAGAVGAIVPLLAGRRRLAGLRAAGEGGEPFRLRGAAGFAGSATVITVADQVLINGAPLLVIAAGGPDAAEVAGVVFAATMLVRAPVFVFQGLAAALLPNFTHLQTSHSLAPFRDAVTRTARLLAAFGVLLVAGTAIAGPFSLRLLFGEDFAAGRLELVLLAVGVAFYLVSTTLSQALLALDLAGRSALAWAASAGALVGLYAVLPGEPLLRVSAAFAGAAVVGAAILTPVIASRLRVRRPEPLHGGLGVEELPHAVTGAH
ncbi:MAG: hypothetical protein R3C15_00665 [Thermoleophilia bacterium]